MRVRTFIVAFINNVFTPKAGKQRRETVLAVKKIKATLFFLSSRSLLLSLDKIDGTRCEKIKASFIFFARLLLSLQKGVD